jgi:hypothetical protein
MPQGRALEIQAGIKEEPTGKVGNVHFWEIQATKSGP